MALLECAAAEQVSASVGLFLAASRRVRTADAGTRHGAVAEPDSLELTGLAEARMMSVGLRKVVAVDSSLEVGEAMVAAAGSRVATLPRLVKVQSMDGAAVGNVAAAAYADHADFVQLCAGGAWAVVIASPAVVVESIVGRMKASTVSCVSAD